MANYLKLNSFILFSLLISFSSCYKDVVDHDNKTIYGSGGLTTHKLSLDAFSKISLTGHAKITVVKGDALSVVIRAQQNIFDVLDNHVSGGKLFLGVKDNYNISTSEGIFVDIVCPGAITDVSIAGAGDLDISGSSQESFSATISGSGNIKAYNLEVDNFSLVVSGAGNGFVWVNKKLDVIISGAGSVTYKGHPSVSQIISGIGSVKDGN